MPLSDSGVFCIIKTSIIRYHVAGRNFIIYYNNPVHWSYHAFLFCRKFKDLYAASLSNINYTLFVPEFHHKNLQNLRMTRKQKP